MIFVSFFLLFFFLLVLSNYSNVAVVTEWFLSSSWGSNVWIVFFWDMYSFLFCLVVLLISLVVFFYSIYYMDGEKNRLGFMLLLLSFVFSMLILLISPNLISLLVGWDGLGVTSYLLVIYYSSASSSVAGMVTFLTNRLGDVFFLFSIAVSFIFFDWEKISFSQIMIVVTLIIAFMTKSAQVPFSAWLPAAMAAPTPVSSLVHSSTLVTAGLYLMIRFVTVLSSFIFYVLWAGLLTLLLAGFMAVFEWDLKKLIAFSTLSQLGFMVSAYAMGMIWISFFHLVTHALFKASLFLSAGILIHSADNSQEFRNMFSVPVQIFWVGAVINICLLCLCGVPFTSGFYSKDLVVDGSTFSFLVFLLYLLGVLFTIIYSSRFFFFSFRVFFSRPLLAANYENIMFLVFPLFGLVMCALMGGWFVFEVFFSCSLLVFVSLGWKLFYFLFLFFVLWVSSKFNKICDSSYSQKLFFSSMWFLKILTSSKMFYKLFSSSKKSLKNIDQGILEVAGPQGAHIIFSSFGIMSFRLQSFSFIVFFLSALIFLFFV